MIQVVSKTQSYGIKFPTSISEITPEIWNTITSKVKIPKYHAVVALCFKTKLFDFVISASNNKNTSVSITPIIAKIADDDAKEINVNVGEQIIIDRSTLERGNHISINTMISSFRAYNYLSEDIYLRTCIVNRKDDKIFYDSDENKYISSIECPEVVIVEFKIIPINDIHGAISNNVQLIDPFKITAESN